MWADRSIMEQAAMLRILFYLFYGLVPYEATLITELARIFFSDSFGSKPGNYALLSNKARGVASTIPFMCSLILIESFQLECLFTDPM
jgi:hypothetical protein